MGRVNGLFVPVVGAPALFAGRRPRDGRRWHGCHRHATAPRLEQRVVGRERGGNRRRDAATNRCRPGLGWTVLRFWEDGNMAMAADRVPEAWLSHHRPRRPASSNSSSARRIRVRLSEHADGALRRICVPCEGNVRHKPIRITAERRIRCTVAWVLPARTCGSLASAPHGAPRSLPWRRTHLRVPDVGPLRSLTGSPSCRAEVTGSALNNADSDVMHSYGPFMFTT